MTLYRNIHAHHRIDAPDPLKYPIHATLSSEASPVVGPTEPSI